MKKALGLTGPGLTLRPARADDLPFLFELRQRANQRNTVSRVADYEAHRAWFESYLTRDDDYLFIAESRERGRPCGSSALHDLDRRRASAEFGRWLAWPGRGLGPEIFGLTFQIGFEQLKLRRIYLRVMERNRPVVDFYLAAGLRPLAGWEPEMINGALEPMRGFETTAEQWAGLSAQGPPPAVGRKAGR